MGNQIILAPEAEQDLHKDVAYIARDNPTAAERFGIPLLDRIEVLKAFPRLGKRIRGTSEERVLVEWPILIFYRFIAERSEIQIKRFWHAARGTPEL